MKTQSIDTHPDAEKVLISLVREATVAERFSRVCVLSATVRRLSKRAIWRANRGKSEMDVNLLFVEYHYGKEISLRLREFFLKRKNDVEWHVDVFNQEDVVVATYDILTLVARKGG